MEDLASAPLENVKEWGPESISGYKSTTDVCSVNPQCRCCRKVLGGVTRPPAVPCTFP